MGKRGKQRDGNGAGASSSSGFHTSMSIREEASGRKQSHNPKSLLKLKHLQNLAVWASGEPQIGSLGAFYGHSFADFGQSLGIPPDPSLFPCQRCETILQPGFNCTVRIEKNQAKKRRRTTVKTPAQNNVVYTCHFCSHRNLKRGTLKGYVKEIAPSRVVSTNNQPVSSAPQKGSTSDKTNAGITTMDNANATLSPVVQNPIDLQTDSLAKPVAKSGATLLDSKRKRKKPGPKKSGDEALSSSAPTEIEKGGGTSKKKKSWTTLKEIAENEERERNDRFKNFSIPFVL